MSIEYSTYDRNFNTASGNLRIVITYSHDSEIPAFNGGVLEISNLKRGYEDDDLLTFAPGVLTLGFADPQRNFFNALKSAFNQTPVSGTGFGYNIHHSCKLYKNNSLIFSGYIDKQSMTYDNTDRIITFDVVDSSIDLKNMSVVLNPEVWIKLPVQVHSVFQKVYPAISLNITNNINSFESDFFNGIFLAHDWQYSNYDGIVVPGHPDYLSRSLNISIDPLGWNNIYAYHAYIRNSATNYYDYIRNLALEFGCCIGVSDYNKIYVNKRFSVPQNTVFQSLESSCIDYYSQIHLRNVKGSRININKNGSVYSATAGTFETVDEDINGVALYPDLVVEQRGFNTERINPDNTGFYSYRITNDALTQEANVLNGVYDPTLAIRERHHWLLARWLYMSRKNVKEKVSLTLKGTDYYMHRFYSFTHNDSTVKFRPLEITYDLLNSSTNLIGLEI